MTTKPISVGLLASLPSLGATRSAGTARQIALNYILGHPIDDDPEFRSAWLSALRSPYAAGDMASEGNEERAHYFWEHASYRPFHVKVASQDFSVLEQWRPEVASLARFTRHVEHANLHFCAALEDRYDVNHWWPAKPRRPSKRQTWLALFAAHSLGHWRFAREALSLDWSPFAPADLLLRNAFWSLSELTPADAQLKRLFDTDRTRACHVLIEHVDVVARQIELAMDIAEEVADREVAQAVADDAARRTDLERDLLVRAGEALSLTQAAQGLGMSRQALHKRIVTGSTLGVVVDEKIVVPSIQFVEKGDKKATVAGLKAVTTLFAKAGAGRWATLQFLIDIDPNLGATPLDRLKAGDVEAVVQAARACLAPDGR